MSDREENKDNPIETDNNSAPEADTAPETDSSHSLTKSQQINFAKKAILEKNITSIDPSAESQLTNFDRNALLEKGIAGEKRFISDEKNQNPPENNESSSDSEE